MTIREARAEDAGAIAGITNAIIRDTLITFTTMERSPSDIAADIAARREAFLVCEAKGKVAGFATYGPFRGGSGYAHSVEHSIQLDTDSRGLGLGRALMARLEVVARDAGHHVMVAGISAANPGAVAFHAAMGFAEVGRMPEVGRKQGRWLDLVLMQKILVSGADDAPDSAGPLG
ncbi:GNAT family N-acetyltransferase [Lutimaribacter marinistellae]|uniref:GNAT family N-acetyltransferase n=1 Tax=Lutimaribacter marinistellae TaxID=1820329 RepID=A0ABV7TIZ4_9RHOB